MNYNHSHDTWSLHEVISCKKQTHVHILWVYDFIFSFIFGVLNWNILAFVVYAIAYDIILIMITKKSYNPFSRIPGFFLKFYGWLLGRIAAGDEDPLRRIQDTSRTPKEERLDFPRYCSAVHEMFPAPMRHVDRYFKDR